MGNPTARILPNGDRILEDTHGTFISVKVRGDVAYFDATQMQLLLATAVSLFSIANLIVNTYAENIWKHSRTYKMSKYDTTIDLNAYDSLCGVAIEPGTVSVPKTYTDDSTNHNFVEDFIGLDGEALRFAATLMFKVHQEAISKDARDDIKKDIGTHIYAHRQTAAGYVSLPENQVSPADNL